MTMDTPSIYDGDFDSLRLGLCQIETEPWAVEANLSRTLDALDAAAADGAEIAVTPECVLHGYGFPGPDDPPERILQAAEPLDGPRLAQVRERAAALGLNVLIGFCERAEGDRLHNAAALISTEGEILNVYRKVHCRPSESTEHGGIFTPGDRFTMTELQLGDRTCNVGTMICFDREIPESARSLRAMGSHLILCPLATDTSDLTTLGVRAHNEMITQVRAAENELFIAVVNHARRFNGGTFVVGPSGEVLCQLGADPEVRVIDVPFGVVPEKFHSKPLGWMGWGFRRPEVYERHLP